MFNEHTVLCLGKDPFLQFFDSNRKQKYCEWRKYVEIDY